MMATISVSWFVLGAVLGIFLLAFPCVRGRECHQIDQCSCKFDDGSIFDISPLGSQRGDPLIKDMFAADTHAYSFNPCYPFTEGTCVNAAGCQFDLANVIYYNIGDPAKVAFSSDGLNVTGTYIADDNARTSTVTYTCDPNQDIPATSVRGEVAPGIYGFTIVSKYACPIAPSTLTNPPTIPGTQTTISGTKTTIPGPEPNPIPYCHTDNQCGCTFDDGRGSMDLSQLGTQTGVPLIHNVRGPDNVAYSFNPCYAFNEGTCKNVAACQFDTDNGTYEAIGDASDVVFFYNYKAAIVGTYKSKLYQRKTVVTYICNPNVTVPYYTVDGESGGEGIFGFTITSMHACPVKAPPSPTPPTPTPLVDCVKKDDCSCQFIDGRGTLDLALLGIENGNPLIYNQPAPDGYDYSYNPCFPFTEDVKCNNTAACQYDTKGQVFYNLGDANNVAFSVSGQNVVVTYKSDDGTSKRTTEVTLICDETSNDPYFQVNGETRLNVYTFGVTSRHACPQKLTTASVKDTTTENPFSDLSTRRRIATTLSHISGVTTEENHFTHEGTASDQSTETARKVSTNNEHQKSKPSNIATSSSGNSHQTNEPEVTIIESNGWHQMDGPSRLIPWFWFNDRRSSKPLIPDKMKPLHDTTPHPNTDKFEHNKDGLVHSSKLPSLENGLSVTAVVAIVSVSVLVVAIFFAVVCNFLARINGTGNRKVDKLPLVDGDKYCVDAKTGNTTSKW